MSAIDCSGPGSIPIAAEGNVWRNVNLQGKYDSSSESWKKSDSARLNYTNTVSYSWLTVFGTRLAQCM